MDGFNQTNNGYAGVIADLFPLPIRADLHRTQELGVQNHLRRLRVGLKRDSTHRVSIYRPFLQVCRWLCATGPAEGQR